MDYRTEEPMVLRFWIWLMSPVYLKAYIFHHFSNFGKTSYCSLVLAYWDCSSIFLPLLWKVLAKFHEPDTKVVSLAPRAEERQGSQRVVFVCLHGCM